MTDPIPRAQRGATITAAFCLCAGCRAPPGIAQNLRRLLDRGQVREEPLPGGATGYRIAEDGTGPSASGREGDSGG